ncbi:ATP-binding protein [Ferruginibacter paludis]|uniref:sensor histidine kinase n=1 Tax=Ferruginibacter paludis TaxID=1310417 RepID=UPI0025B60F13|nr:ATP-binding protein [Ferruginibacter paludis]MDN3657275.1 ATP-binding protein [Ferruginibacter paludis]
MNQHLQHILQFIEQNNNMTAEEKNALLKSIKDADKEFEITAFKLDRTEKVKKTTAILLEETIEELDHKQKAVEAQNRELEIEASLERVRTIAMGMSAPEDLLNISQANYKELTKLGFSEIRNSLIGIFHDDKNYFTDYDYSDFSGGSITNIPYNKNSIIDKSIQQMKSATDAFTEFIVEGKELEEWKAFRKQNGEYEDTRLIDANALYYYFYSIEQGNVGISTFKKISEEQLNILKRFRNVFDLAYKRYTDITTAEAQAREAQIETGLERVRSRSMAMHKTSELQEVINTVHKELLNLNIAINGGSFIAINNDIETTLRCWGSGGTADTSEEVHLPLYEKPFCSNLINGIKNGPGFFTEEYTQEEKKDFFTFLFEHEPWSKLDAEQKKETLSSPGGYTRSCCVSMHTSIFIINHFGEPFSAADDDILKRFGKVFEQTYTRFLDLQKAEAQARESQIQLALERVRARTMAMQKSDELAQVASLLFAQVIALGINCYSSGFTVWENENNELISWMCNADGSVNPPFRMPAFDIEWHKQQFQSWKNQEEYIIHDFTGNEMQEFYRYLRSFPLLDEAFKKSEAAGVQTPVRQVHNAFNFSYGNLLYITLQPSPESYTIFKRFAKVFEQTYTRFLDLQRAEAQAREAQIEASLERVRSRSMAMHQSAELTDVANVLFQQLRNLGGNLWGCGFVLCMPGSDDDEVWFANENGVLPPIAIPHTKDPTHKKMYEGWKNKMDLCKNTLEGKALNDHYDYMLSVPSVKTFFENILASGLSFPTRQTWHAAYFKYGYVLTITLEAYTDEQVFIRFAKVFEQAYTRFLDLQKAEAQTREAEIELALERVRARTMAMQHSDELQAASLLLFRQVESLGLPPLACGFNIWDDDRKAATAWMGSISGLLPPFKTDSSKDVYQKIYEAAQTGKPLFVIEQSGKELEVHYQYLATIPTFREVIMENWRRDGVSIPTFQIIHCVYFTHGYLMFISFERVAAYYEIFKRFAIVFEQTYTRFLDLQKAEAQAREAQVEAAMEKIRSRSLAMHNSDELKEVIALIFEKLDELDVLLGTVGIWLFDKNSMNSFFWVGNKLQAPTKVNLPYSEVLMSGENNYSDSWKAWLSGTSYFNKQYTLEQKNEYFDYVFANNGFDVIPADVRKIIIQSSQHLACMITEKNTALFVDSWNTSSYNEDQIVVLKRAAKVFEQTYTRFLDLQKAEAQAREATIEAALEKVRSSSMAMHKSDELHSVIRVVTEQFAQLGFHFDTANFVTKYTDEGSYWYISTPGISTPAGMYCLATDIVFFKRLSRIVKAGEGFYTEALSFQEKNEFFSYVFEKTLLKYTPEDRKQYVYNSKGAAFSLAVSKNVILSIANYQLVPYTVEENLIIKRIANVFEQSYRRFLDLQKAEAQAREAQIETALEKVRSRTLAMQKSDELAETAAVLFQQLIALGIAPNRLYIAIVKDENGASEFWITDEDGKKISTAFDANLNDNPSFASMFEGWKQQKKSLIIDMQGEELQNYFRHLTSLGVPFKNGLSQKRRVQDIAYFSKGFIGIASPDDQPKETLQLLERFAAVFNLTFTRFNDLQIAEAHALQAEQDLIAIKEARQKAESALTELQATQKQLIQSEKMASLGELTAGIAHEIQNPLNFVNNFSEVSKELLEEMKEAMDKGDTTEAKEIMNDVILNLEKINHHGKRADGIVKGMLQHSRSSSSQREPTDINALADEYLRLAYHGLRAKDKSFNATLKTNYDDAIGNINIVPQDIGRVILNLISNAFYAVNEKNQSLVANPAAVKYEPTVSVSTKKINDQIEISVADNGNGIPSPVKDKIFQPFFTTKPTGQGTGLGLSLVYDIVKAHGGELRVETKENEGSEFLVQLPAN